MMLMRKHNGNGFTLCAGCLAAGVYASHWDRMITEVYYESGESIGCFCSHCLENIENKYKLVVIDDENRG